MCLGFATRVNAQQGALTFFENDAAGTMDTFQRRSINDCLVLPDATSVLEAEAQISTWDASGFTLNWSDPVAAASSRVFYYIALQGGQYDTAAVATPTVTGNSAVTTGFQPKAVFFGALNRTLAADTTTTAAGDAGICYGAVDSALNQRAVGINETDANTASQSWRGNSATKCVRLLKGLRAAKATRAEAQADAGAMTSTGFQLNWTTVDAAAYQYHYLAFGDNPPPAAAPPSLVTARTRT
jgi:hypothetical protein